MPSNRDEKKVKTAVVIVAHPDDETLWAGGTILCHPEWSSFVVCLCRKSDAERAFNFEQALKALGATGAMGDMDDGPEQLPLNETALEQTILQLLPSRTFDLIISHNITGEYTTHLRHTEVSRAVIMLWHKGAITTDELWTFAYEDGNKQHLPFPIQTASIYNVIPLDIWKRKYAIITNEFGFKPNSWEAKTTPRDEAFWRFTNSDKAFEWLKKGGIV